MAATKPIGRDPVDGKLKEFVLAGTDAFVPTYIALGDTFTIPADKQGIAAVPITVDGTLIVNGTLITLYTSSPRAFSFFMA